MMKTPMEIAAKNLAGSDDKKLLGARYRADCDQAGVQAAEEGIRPAATRASASDARSGQCLDLTHWGHPLSCSRRPKAAGRKAPRL
jgi:hypothetical protein